MTSTGDFTFPIRIRALCEQERRATPASLVIASIVVTVMWRDVPRPWLMAWLGALILTYSARLLAYRGFLRDPQAEAHAAAWAARVTALLLLTGVVWGSGAAVLSLAAPPLVQAFWLVVTYGMAAGGVSATAYHRPAQVAYIVPILCLPVAGLLWQGGVERLGLAVGLALFVLYALAQGAGQARILRDSIAMRQQNRDLVDKLQHEKTEAEAARRIAEDAVREKSLFFAAASHDLRQPLHAMGLFSAALRDSDPTPGQRPLIRQIEAGVDSLESLFHELLDVSRLDAGDIRPTPSHFALQRLYGELRIAFEPVARQKGLDFALLAPRPAHAIWLQTDFTLLHRIVANFTANAVRNTRQGTVAVACRRTDRGWRIEVRDTGPGIAAEHHARIFEEFHQLNNPQRDRARGLGLGLSTARRMARLLDTPIGLRSCPDQGSTFWVEVPGGAPAPAAKGAVALPADPLTGRRLLVVDDDPAIRAGMRSLLEAWGAEVVTAADSAEALATLGDSAPDLLISDWALVSETGPQAIAVLRQRFPGQPALLMTADSATERRTQAGELGVDLLVKPVQPARLRAALNSLLCAQPVALLDKSKSIANNDPSTLG